MSTLAKYALVLAIYPNTRGYAFVLLEGPLAPVDWGIIDVRHKEKNRYCLRRIAVLLGRYEPCAVVLQDMSPRGTSRASRIQRLNEAIATLSDTQGIPVFCYARQHVRKCFVHLGNPTKHAIAEAIVKHIPAFERHIPPQRKPWMSEDSRMGLFDAAALALTFFQIGGASGRIAPA